MHLPGSRPRRFANNKLSWKNQWRCFFCAFYHGNKPLYGRTPRRDGVLAHSRKRGHGILAEFNIIKADQGNIVWNMQPLLRERTKNTDRHEIAYSNDGSKVASLG